MGEWRNKKQSIDATGLRFGLVVSRYHEEIVARLLDGARECLAAHGVRDEDIGVVSVPGAWEIPLALQRMARVRERWHGLIALGVVIRGETPHFDYVCSECAAGIQRVSLDHGLPIGFGVLTCDDVDQALARAGGEVGNKGWEAAIATVEMCCCEPVTPVSESSS